MPVVLICEGIDDRAVLAKLVEKRGLGSVRTKYLKELRDVKPDYFLIRPDKEDEGGFDRAKRILEILLINPEMKTMAIVIDADDELNGKKAAIEGLANLVGFEALPQLPWPDGCIVRTPAKRTLGVWIMPDNQSDGKLETLLARTIDSADPNWSYAGHVLNDVEPPRFNEVDRDKAHLRTWLAWQNPPGLQFGTALQARKFNPDHAAFDPLTEWLRKLKEFDQ